MKLKLLSFLIELHCSVLFTSIILLLVKPCVIVSGKTFLCQPTMGMTAGIVLRMSLTVFCAVTGVSGS